MPAFILKHLKPILAVLAVLLIAGAGFLVRGLIADRAELKQQNEVLLESMNRLAAQIELERKATVVAQNAAREARERASTSRKGIENARRTDPVAEDWYNQPLPAGIADSLR